MTTLITVVHVLVCLFLILSILLQAGKGAGMGAAFGGASQTVFGGRGAAPFLAKLTTATALVFMVTSMTLAYIASQQDDSGLQKRAAEQRAEMERKNAREELEKARVSESERQAAETAVVEESIPESTEGSPAEPDEAAEEPAATPEGVDETDSAEAAEPTEPPPAGP